MRILSRSTHFGTIFFYFHVLQHHLNVHHFTSWIRWILLAFFGRLWIRLRPWTFIWFLQTSIAMHAEFICKWYFWDGFWTLRKLLSPQKIYKWIPTIVSTLFSYLTRSYSMSNCISPCIIIYMCEKCIPPFNHDQALQWSSSWYHRGSVVLRHKPHFMPLILWCICSTFFLTLIRSNNQGWMWSNNPLYRMPFGT
jgi:hypothetical protein